MKPSVVGLSLLLAGLFTAPALAQTKSPDPAAKPATKAEPACKEINECMTKGQDQETIDGALAYFSKGISSWKKTDGDANLALALIIRGQTYIQYYAMTQGKEAAHLAKAEQDFLKSSQLDSTKYSAFAGLAVVYANQEKHDKALQMYQKAIDTEPKNPLTYLERSTYYRVQGDAQNVINDMNTAIGMLSGTAYDESTKTYKVRAGINLPPQQRIQLYIQRAQAYLHLGKETEGEADLAQACKLGEKRACKDSD